jgi:hypothetical protein
MSRFWPISRLVVSRDYYTMLQTTTMTTSMAVRHLFVLSWPPQWPVRALHMSLSQNLHLFRISEYNGRSYFYYVKILTHYSTIYICNRIALSDQPQWPWGTCSCSTHPSRPCPCSKRPPWPPQWPNLHLFWKYVRVCILSERRAMYLLEFCRAMYLLEFCCGFIEYYKRIV